MQCPKFINYCIELFDTYTTKVHTEATDTTIPGWLYSRRCAQIISKSFVPRNCWWPVTYTVINIWQTSIYSQYIITRLLCIDFSPLIIFWNTWLWFMLTLSPYKKSAYSSRASTLLWWKKVISAFYIHGTGIVSEYVHMYKCVHVFINTLLNACFKHRTTCTKSRLWIGWLHSRRTCLYHHNS